MFNDANGTPIMVGDRVAVAVNEYGHRASLRVGTVIEMRITENRYHVNKVEEKIKVRLIDTPTVKFGHRNTRIFSRLDRVLSLGK